MHTYLHVLDGRMRVRLPELRGSEARAQAINGILSAIHGVTRVETNVTTGSVLVHFDRRVVEAEVLLEAIGCDPSSSPREPRVPVMTPNTSDSDPGSRVARVLFEKSIEIAATRLLMAII